MLQKLKELSKGELHIHLNGLFETSVIKEIIIEEGSILPPNFDVNKHLNHKQPKSNLVEYLKPWDVLILIPISVQNLSRLVESAFEKLKNDNVKFVEIRSTVIYLSNLLNLNLPKTLEILIGILDIHSYKNDVNYGLIFTISRSEFSSNNLSQLLKSYTEIGKPKRIIGLDLAGNEDYEISSDIPIMFRNARDKFGFNITIHAGETGNTNNIIKAIEDFKADRIGHGTSILGSRKAIELAVKNNVCIEVCPISNQLTNYQIEIDGKHPALFFMENNIPFVICADNPSIHLKSLSDDYNLLYNQGLPISVFENMYETQKKYSFLWK
jgi:adenosine deaminase